MKKYYAYFMSNDAEHVIRFKVKGSLRYDRLSRCFIDKHYYTRTTEDLVKWALHNNDWAFNVKWAVLIDHKTFAEYRAYDIPRVALDNEVIEWD